MTAFSLGDQAHMVAARNGFLLEADPVMCDSDAVITGFIPADFDTSSSDRATWAVWTAAEPPTGQVPEPGTLGLLAAAGGRGFAPLLSPSSRRAGRAGVDRVAAAFKPPSAA